MTDPNLTRICIVLDKSGSMAAVRAATISGYNEFLETQRRAPGRCELDLIFFNHEWSWQFHSVPIENVAPLRADLYQPDGTTALLDAMGQAISQLGQDFAGMLEHKRPGKVVIVAMTDGLENASKLFTRQMVREMIEHQRGRYSWEFVFLGANQDAVLTGTELGISRDTSVTYSGTVKGTKTVMRLAAQKLEAFRTSGASADLNYSATDRAETMEE